MGKSRSGETMPAGQQLMVAADGQSRYDSIAAALRDARPGAVITVAPGRYEENLVISRVVTITAEQARGPVHVTPRRGSVVRIAAEAVKLTGLVLHGRDEDAPAVDVSTGQA